MTCWRYCVRTTHPLRQCLAEAPHVNLRVNVLYLSSYLIPFPRNPDYHFHFLNVHLLFTFFGFWNVPEAGNVASIILVRPLVRPLLCGALRTFSPGH